MRRFLRSLILALVMLTALAGTAAAWHVEPRSPGGQDCVGAHVSDLAPGGFVGQVLSVEATEGEPGHVGGFISKAATTCEFPE